MRAVALSIIVGVPFALGGCRCAPGVPDHVVTVDLLAAMTDGAARSWTADTMSRAMLPRGWSAARVASDGARYRWVTDEEAALRLTGLDPALPTVLELDVSHGAPDLAVTLALGGGRAFEARAIGEEPATVRWDIPAGALRADAPVVTLSSSHLRDDPEPGWDRWRGGADAGGRVAFQVHAVRVRQVPAAVTSAGLALGDAPAVVPVTCGGTCVIAATVAVAGEVRLEVALDPGDGVVEALAPRSVSLREGDVELPLDVPAGAAAFVSLSGTGTLAAPRLVDRRPGIAVPPPPAPTGRRPDVVIYVTDTTRADRLGVVGYGRPTTPWLSALAARGEVTPLVAETSSPWTRPAIATVFTGLDADATGVRTYSDALPPTVPYLPEALQAAGYHTRAYVTNGHIREVTGFARGFDFFDETIGTADRAVGAGSRFKPRVEDVLPTVMAELEDLPIDQPLFLYVHSMGPHSPYRPPIESQAALGARALPELAGERLDRSSRQVDYLDRVQRGRVPPDPILVDALSYLYDAEIHHEDAWLGLLVDQLRALGRWDDTLFVILGDHGEEFGEHGALGHEVDVYGELVRVPAIVHAPRGMPLPEVPEPTLLDVTPTVLMAAGLDPFPDQRGRSWFAGGTTGDQRLVTTHTRQHAALRDGRWRLVTSHTLDTAELYDLATDPTEQRDVAAAHPARVAAMARDIRLRLAADAEIAAKHGRAPAQQTSEDLEALRALGYLQ